jgi:hypothetical protein
MAQDTEERDRLLLYAGLGTAGYFFVVKPLLKKLGIDPADQDAVDAQNALSPVDNPFSTQYSGNSKKDDTYWINVKQLWDENPHNTNSAVSSYDQFVAFSGEGLNDQFDKSGIFWPDYQKVQSFLTLTGSKQGLSDVSSFMKANYGVDLWSLLSNGYKVPLLGEIFPALNTGLSVSDLHKILVWVNNMLATESDVQSFDSSSQPAQISNQ